MQILCIGMMVCDTLISPVPSNILELDSVQIDKPRICCGGDALNVALGLARLNENVSIIGRIAEDNNGRFILEECRKQGIDVSRVVYDEECATAASYALIDEKGERHFLTEKAVFARLEGSDVTNESIEKADIVYIGSAMAHRKMDAGGIEDIFSRAHTIPDKSTISGKSAIPGKNTRLTVMDAAINIEDPERDWLNYLEPAFRQTDVFFPSMDEAAKITGEKQPEKIAEAFRKFSMKLFGIKMGAKGCFVTNFMESRYIQCPQNMPVVDTTGAGDSFMAGLICALSKGWDVFSAAEFASCVATKNVGAVGGTAGVPDFEEALRFYKEYKL